MMRRAIIFVILANMAVCEGIFAEEPPAFDIEAYVASAGHKTVLEIAMVDCVAMALKNNPDIQIRKITPHIEDANVMIQRARFEPSLSFDFNMNDNTDLSDSPLFGPNPSKARTNTFNFGYDQELVTGTDISLDLFNTRVRSNADPRIQAFNPSFDSVAEVTVTQPLLKGFGITVNKADFLIAKNNKLKSIQDLTKNVIDILTDVKSGYYDYQFRLEEYEVASVSLKRVEDLYAINEEKYAKGLASNVDLLESEAEVARFQQALYAAEEAMKSAEDRLKLITYLVDDPNLWNADIRLLEELKYSKYTTDLVGSIRKAFEHRPDYHAAKIDLKNRDISVIYYRNGMLPTVDLVGSYGLNGLAKNYEKDLAHVGGGKYEDWSLGVNVKLPLGSEEDKGRYEKSKFEKRQALIGFKNLEQNIILEVRNAVRDVETKYRMLEASLKAKAAEEENYAAQEVRFKAGLVSTHDIIDYQERLARAELNYALSVINYNKSLIALARAEGTALINDNIVVED